MNDLNTTAIQEDPLVPELDDTVWEIDDTEEYLYSDGEMTPVPQDFLSD